jgi:hypothetical protein
VADPEDGLIEVSSQAVSQACDSIDLIPNLGQPAAASDDFLLSLEMFDDVVTSTGVFCWNNLPAFLGDVTADLMLSSPPLENMTVGSLEDLHLGGRKDTLETIYLQIQETLTLLGYAGPPSQLSCLFHPESIELLTRLCFRHFHRHIPIIHKPSFDPTKAYMPRLIAILLVGGLYSTPEHIEAVRAGLNSADRLILEPPSQSKRLTVAGGPGEDLTWKLSWNECKLCSRCWARIWHGAARTQILHYLAKQ